ncbi:MAG TPA: MarR family transcriptional regulator [Haliangiales bacterium]|nr:MarR family transcriptional regulator [Haliangiales bacterium]
MATEHDSDSTRRAHKAASRMMEECYGFRVRLLNRAVTSVYDEALRPHGLTCAQFNLLVAIEAVGERATPSNLARGMRIGKSTLTRDVDRMVERGWVARASLDDQRSHRLELTAAGRALLLDTVPSWEGAQGRMHRLLGDSQSQALHRMGRQL